MKRIGLAFLGLVALTYPAAAQINCHTDRGRAEQIICSHDDLMAMDEAMSALYFRINNAVNRPSARRLLNNQREWLADRNACRSAGCLRRLYGQRIREFQDVLD